MIYQHIRSFFRDDYLQIRIQCRLVKEKMLISLDKISFLKSCLLVMLIILGV
ncbi:MAG: hypothetical protein PWP07_1270 [Epulopiscium sp.]|nr:hypothetical protein [Candidatus Epulonipiscium sp.]